MTPTESEVNLRKAEKTNERILDDAQRILARIENLQSTYRSALQSRDSEISKRIAIIAGLSISWNVYGAIWGSNFNGLPFDSPGWMYGSLGGAALVSAFLLGWAYYRNWWSSPK
jgi:Mg2+ and Co2+ transporter CorA